MSGFARILTVILGCAIFVLEAKTAFYYPFISGKVWPLRIVLSIGASLFVLLVVGVFAFTIVSLFWFFKMSNNPRDGLTIFDSRLGGGKPVYSKQYLNESGLFARSRLLTMMKSLLACWVGAVLLDVSMYYISR